MAEKNSEKKKSKVAVAKAKAAEKAAIAKEKKVVRSVNRQASGFAEFIRNQNVVALGVGIAIGSVATGTVKSIVDNFVNPLVQFIIGTHSHLEAQSWHVELWGRRADFGWGASLSSLITLVATIYIIYLLVHFARLDRLKKSD